MFNTGLVIHYVREYSEDEIKQTKKVLNEYVINKKIDPLVEIGEYFDNLVENLPVGTIICIDLTKSKEKKAHICFPMFSSHMSLPVKKGEIVWFYSDTDSEFDDATQAGSPLLSVNNFWLSRKIGSKFSEDLNYAHIMRDSKISDSLAGKENITKGQPNKTVNDKNNNKKIKKEELKIIKLPDYSITDAYKSRWKFLSGFNTLYGDAKKANDFLPNAVPRWYSKPYELSLQGSNNSLINLTKTHNNKESFKNGGAIDLVAGRHTIEEYNTVNEENDFYVVNDKFVDNIADKEKRKIDELKINKKKSYSKIKNVNDDVELLKNQLVYFGEAFSKKSDEGNLNLDSDASRIYISEFDNIDNTSFYDTSSILRHSLVSFEKEKINVVEEKDYLTKKKNININNFSLNSIALNDAILPSIFIKSNDIRIVARKERKNSEKELKEGSVRIVKESNNFYNSAHLLLESDGRVLIDGSSIMIGDFNKELIRHGNNQGPIDIDKMHGNGFGVLLGYDQNISEPLVLGNTLQSVLEEMININIQLVEEVKTLTDDLQNHVHLGIPGPGVSGTVQIPTPYSNFSGSKQKKLKERYTNIQKNLKDILSRFAKTS